MEEKNNLEKIIKERIKEYNLAIEYFQKNKLESQESEAKERLQKLNEYLKKLSSEINENDIPEKVTPEFICGYSKEERIQKYLEIITKIILEKEKLDKKLSDITSQFCKEVTIEEIESQENKIHKNFDKLCNFRRKSDSCIKLLTEDFSDEWTPAPLYDEGREPEIIIYIKKTGNKEKNKKILVNAKLTGTNLEEEWEANQDGDWNHFIEWGLTNEEYNSIRDKSLALEISEIEGGGQKVKGKIKLDFPEKNKEYEEYEEFEEKLKFNFEPKKDSSSFTVTIDFNLSSEAKFIKLRKIFPSFLKFINK